MAVRFNKDKKNYNVSKFQPFLFTASKLIPN